MKIPKLYEQGDKHSSVDDHILYVRLSDPLTGWTWYIAEYDPNDRIAFGYVEGLENEWGYIDINELDELPTIIMDSNFKPITFKELKSKEENYDTF